MSKTCLQIERIFQNQRLVIDVQIKLFIRRRSFNRAYQEDGVLLHHGARLERGSKS